MKPEYLSFAVNLVCFSYYLIQRSEPGKILYWLGALLLTGGLLRMKG